MSPDAIIIKCAMCGGLYVPDETTCFVRLAAVHSSALLHFCDFDCMSAKIGGPIEWLTPLLVPKEPAATPRAWTVGGAA